MGFRLQQKSMTSNDLERGRNGRLLSAVLICSFVLKLVFTARCSCKFDLSGQNSVSVSICLTVCLCHRCVHCDKTKESTVDVLIPYERPILHKN